MNGGEWTVNGLAASRRRARLIKIKNIIFVTALKRHFMYENDWRDKLPAKVRVLQIIIGGMIVGCLLLLLVSLFLATLGKHEADKQLLTYIGLAAAGMILGVWIVAPGVIISQGRKNIYRTQLLENEQSNPKQAEDKTEKENDSALSLIALFFTKTLVAGALLEGAVFLLLIIYIAESSILSVSAAIVLLILPIAQMPTIGRVTNWIENQMRLLDEEQAFE